MNPAVRFRLGIVLIIVFVAVLSFILGAYSGLRGEPALSGARGGVVLSCDPNTLQALSIPKAPTSQPLVATASSAAASNSAKAYFASKNGTKFYAAGCASAQKRIKPENLIWFSSAEDATLQGFTRGSSC